MSNTSPFFKGLTSRFLSAQFNIYWLFKDTTIGGVQDQNAEQNLTQALETAADELSVLLDKTQELAIDRGTSDPTDEQVLACSRVEHTLDQIETITARLWGELHLAVVPGLSPELAIEYQEEVEKITKQFAAAQGAVGRTRRTPCSPLSPDRGSEAVDAQGTGQQYGSADPQDTDQGSEAVDPTILELWSELDAITIRAIWSEDDAIVARELQSELDAIAIQSEDDAKAAREWQDIRH